MEPREAALSAGSQFLVPLGVASITTISAFLPMLLLEGTEGEFAFSLGAVVTIMLLGSWLTALYVVPYLCMFLLRRSRKPGGQGPGLRAHGWLVRRLLPFGLPITVLALLAVGYSASQFSRLKPEMFPFRERADFLVYRDLPSDTAISETERMALRVQDWLADKTKNPELVNSTVYVGDGGPRFNLGLDPADPCPASAFFQVNPTSLAAVEEMVERARRVFVERFPEARFRVTRLPQGGQRGGRRRCRDLRAGCGGAARCRRPDRGRRCRAARHRQEREQLGQQGHQGRRGYRPGQGVRVRSHFARHLGSDGGLFFPARSIRPSGRTMRKSPSCCAQRLAVGTASRTLPTSRLPLAGGALFEPMATIMIGGLAVASPLTRLVVPPLCHVLLRPRGRARHKRAAALSLTAAPFGGPAPPRALSRGKAVRRASSGPVPSAACAAPARPGRPRRSARHGGRPLGRRAAAPDPHHGSPAPW